MQLSFASSSFRGPSSKPPDKTIHFSSFIIAQNTSKLQQKIKRKNFIRGSKGKFSNEKMPRNFRSPCIYRAKICLCKCSDYSYIGKLLMQYFAETKNNMQNKI